MYFTISKLFVVTESLMRGVSVKMMGGDVLSITIYTIANGKLYENAVVTAHARDLEVSSRVGQYTIEVVSLTRDLLGVKVNGNYAEIIRIGTYELYWTLSSVITGA